jgi:hypothetical protein
LREAGNETVKRHHGSSRRGGCGRGAGELSGIVRWLSMEPGGKVRKVQMSGLGRQWLENSAWHGSDGALQRRAK